MNVNIDNSDIVKASQRGLELLRSDIATPNKWNADLLCLDLLLQNIVDGRMVVQPAEQLPEMKVVPKAVHDIDGDNGEQKTAN